MRFFTMAVILYPRSEENFHWLISLFRLWQIHYSLLFFQKSLNDSLYDQNPKIKNMLIFNSVNLINRSQVAKLNSMQLFSQLRSLLFLKTISVLEAKFTQLCIVQQIKIMPRVAKPKLQFISERAKTSLGVLQFYMETHRDK